jgi:hypothetical protein
VAAAPIVARSVASGVYRVDASEVQVTAFPTIGREGRVQVFQTGVREPVFALEDLAVPVVAGSADGSFDRIAKVD